MPAWMLHGEHPDVLVGRVSETPQGLEAFKRRQVKGLNLLCIGLTGAHAKVLHISILDPGQAGLAGPAYGFARQFALCHRLYAVS